MQTAALNPTTVLEALGFADVQQIEPIAEATATAVWKVTQDGAAYALRVFGKGEEHVWRKERAVLQAAHAHGLPVPVIKAAEVVDGCPAMLASWCAGEPWGRYALAHLDAIEHLSVLFGEAQAHIHAVPAPLALQEAGVDWIAWAGPKEPEIQERLRALPLRSDALLHLDYHPNNVLTDGERITGVVDWVNALTGDPRADLARTAALMLTSPPPPEIPIRLYFRIRRQFTRAWRKAYAAMAGEPEEMALFYAWGGAATIRDREEAQRWAGRDFPADHAARLRRWTQFWKYHAGITKERKDA